MFWMRNKKYNFQLNALLSGGPENDHWTIYYLDDHDGPENDGH